MNEKLTAYALNELPPDERAELKAQLQSDPTLAVQAAELEEFCQLLGKHIAPEADSLTNEQRLSLIKTFKASPVKPAAVRPWRRLLVLSTTALAACLAVMLVKNQNVQPETSADLIADAKSSARRMESSERVTVTPGKLDAPVKAAPATESPVLKKEATVQPVLAAATPPPHELREMKALRDNDAMQPKDLPTPKIAAAPPTPMSPAAAAPAAPADPEPRPLVSPVPAKGPAIGGNDGPELTMGSVVTRQEAFKNPLSADDVSRLSGREALAVSNAAAPPLAGAKSAMTNSFGDDGSLIIKGGTGDIVLYPSDAKFSVRLDLGNLNEGRYAPPAKRAEALLPWATVENAASGGFQATSGGIVGGWASTAPEFSTKAGTLDVSGMIADSGRADSSSSVNFSTLMPKPSQETLLSPNVSGSGGGNLTLSGASTFSGGVVLNSGVSSSMPPASPNSDLTVTGAISGTSGIVNSGSGTLTVNGSNTYTGNTVISAGVLSTSQSEGAMSPVTAANSLILSSNSSNTTALTTDSGTALSRSAGADVRFKNNGAVTLGTGTLQMTPVADTPAPTTITAATTSSGSISVVGGNSLTKAGDGTLTLNGSSTGDSSKLANSGATISSGATLSLSGSGGVTFGGTTGVASNQATGAMTIINSTGLSSATPVPAPAAAKAKSTTTVAPSSVDGYIADNTPSTRSRMLNEVSDKWEQTPSAVPAPVTVMNAGGGTVVLKEGQELKTFGPTRLDIAQEKAAQPAPGLLVKDGKIVSEIPTSRAIPVEKPVPDNFKLTANGQIVPNSSAITVSPPPPVPASQTYRPIIENPFTYVAQEPLSTFSTDVDTASYANVRRFLNHGQRPPADAVRLEELINYFPYSYEPPADDKPFAVHVDLAEAPWQPLHRLARIGLKAREIHEERRAANFVFLLDVSGSMSPPERLPLIKQGLRLLVEQLREDDHVAIVTYAGESGVALESTGAAEKERIMQVIDKLKAGGSTNGASGIRLAYEQAALNFHKDHINRVILATDGDFNVGASSVNELEALIAEKAKTGVFLSVLGVGTDNLKDHTMQTLADRGNGNYHYLDSLSEARKVLVDQMTGTLVTVAKDVKIQVEFNPAQVAAYRLIGYEKRMLAKQDFNNDKKDAGEIGAGHTITALYEIVPASLKYPDGKPLVDDLKYAPKPAAPAEPQSATPNPPSAIELMTVKLRYKAPDGDKSQLMEQPVTDAGKKLSEAPKDFQFAVSAAGFGMLLRDSQQRGDLNWELVRSLAQKGKGDDPNGYRGEFLQLIDKARSVCEPK